MKRKNLIGNVYGDFTVIDMLYGYSYDNRGYPRTYCKCIGTDGNEYIIRTDALTTGATKSIGGVGQKCTKKDLTNCKFGLLTVLYDTNIRDNGGHVLWHCKCDCGNECDVLSSNLITHHTLSCGCKNKSKWEEFIARYLAMNNIKYIEQFRFGDCMNEQQTATLPFDFYLPDYNFIIEYDGMHHFEPIEYWGGQDKFEIIQRNDFIKNRYCQENNIQLLRLSYELSYEEITNLINQFLFS